MWAWMRDSRKLLVNGVASDLLAHGCTRRVLRAPPRSCHPGRRWICVVSIVVKVLWRTRGCFWWREPVLFSVSEHVPVINVVLRASRGGFVVIFWQLLPSSDIPTGCDPGSLYFFNVQWSQSAMLVHCGLCVCKGLPLSISGGTGFGIDPKICGCYNSPTGPRPCEWWGWFHPGSAGCFGKCLVISGSPAAYDVSACVGDFPAPYLLGSTVAGKIAFFSSNLWYLFERLLTAANSYWRVSPVWHLPRLTSA